VYIVARAVQYWNQKRDELSVAILLFAHQKGYVLFLRSLLAANSASPEGYSFKHKGGRGHVASVKGYYFKHKG